MIKVCMRKTFDRDGFAFWLFEHGENGIRLAKPISFEFGEEKGSNEAFWLPPEPTFYLRSRDFDSIKDSILTELIGSGLEPSAIKNQAELAATKKHLADLQTFFKESQSMVRDLATWVMRK